MQEPILGQNGQPVVFGFLDEYGQAISRTPVSNPYSFDGFIIAGTPYIRGNEPEHLSTVYDDRMRAHDYSHYRALQQMHLGKETDRYDGIAVDRIEALLRDFFQNPGLTLRLVMKYCNVSTGYPCYRFDFQRNPTVVSIPNYVSDGPGYSGPVSLTLEGANAYLFTQKSDMAQPAFIALPAAVPPVTAVAECTTADLDFVWGRLSKETREYLGEVAYIDTDVTRILHFADGQRGFVMFHGEACFFTLAIPAVTMDIAVESEVSITETHTEQQAPGL